MIDESISDDVRPHLLFGTLIAALLVIGLGGWAATANLAGAVIAAGTVVVDSNVKKVQHPTGGVVGEIKVRDGDRVQHGDLLLRLDETLTRANLAVIVSQLNELAVRQSRLRAERDGAEGIGETLPRPSDYMIDRGIAEIMAGERTLFESRRRARAGQKAQLQERIAQLREEISGVDAQRVAKTRELALVGAELAEVEKLWDKNLMPLSKVTAIRRDAARIEGERAQLTATTAQAKGKITEIELQIIQIDNETRLEVMKDLREAQAKEAELIERRVAAEDQLKRVEIRAPQSGIVHQLSVHTVGGVITQSEPVMLIVPEDETLVIETKVLPQDIDHVHVGQAAFIRFTAFNQRTTPEFQGQVMRVSADLNKDPQTGQAYFIARISLRDAESKKLGSLRLVPGMPAEVHIATGDRTAISYLLKPLTDQFAKAFSER